MLTRPAIRRRAHNVGAAPPASTIYRSFPYSIKAFLAISPPITCHGLSPNLTPFHYLTVPRFVPQNAPRWQRMDDRPRRPAPQHPPASDRGRGAALRLRWPEKRQPSRLAPGRPIVTERRPRRGCSTVPTPGNTLGIIPGGSETPVRDTSEARSGLSSGWRDPVGGQRPKMAQIGNHFCRDDPSSLTEFAIGSCPSVLTAILSRRAHCPSFPRCARWTFHKRDSSVGPRGSGH